MSNPDSKKRRRPVGPAQAPPADPIDPLTGPKLALSGRLVLMDDAFRVIPQGTVYIDRSNIVAVTESRAPRPAGFEAVTVVDVGGTIFPGLIELHNHLAYNALQLWQVPKKYYNRDQWSGTALYRKLISGPMKIIGNTPELVPALVRYVECKSLFGGVTTSQGIQLFSHAGIRRYYRGIVRNVEQTNEAALPNADARVDDIDAKDASRFLRRLEKATCFLLHLSEGIDERARKHFLALQISDDQWAIGKQLAGIHCAGLSSEDFNVLGSRQGAMVWSPLSNLLLYGQTADVGAAKQAGVRIGIGSDWAPSGSKNLLGELKVARLVSQEMAGVFSDRDIVAMATRQAASILQWDQVLGSLEPGKRADLMVIAGKSGDPYEQLLEATETSVRLVMINGVARYGLPSLMQRLGAAGESIRVGRSKRTVFLRQDTADPTVTALTLKDATDMLQEALQELPELAAELEAPPDRPRPRLSGIVRGMSEAQEWTLALDELEDSGVELRPRLPMRGERELTGALRGLDRAAAALSQVVEPLTLDPLTVADDPAFLTGIEAQPNLPDYVKAGLKRVYV
ncbi:MAG: amidohydrolase family protein [Nitrospira sp.]|nr:amidohydrolase family protein [Nitrospira sp.]